MKSLLLFCVPAIWAQPCMWMDSARTFEDKDDLLGALDQYEVALDSCPARELEIRSQLQGYYESLDLKEDARLNLLLLQGLKDGGDTVGLPALRSTTPVAAEPVELETQGLYGSWNTGTQNWKLYRYADSLDYSQYSTTLKLGYEWAWGNWIHDLSAGFGLSLDRDASSASAKGLAKLGTLSKNPEWEYVLSYGSWSADFAWARSVSGLSLLQNKVLNSSALNAADTTISKNFSMSYDRIKDGLWLRPSLNLEWIEGQSRDWNLMLYGRKSWGDWSLSGSVALGQSADLYDNYAQEVYTGRLDSMGANLDGALAYLARQNPDTTVRWGQNYLNFSLDPKWQYGALALGLSSRLSLEMESQKEKYYLQAGSIYSDAVVETPRGAVGMVDMGNGLVNYVPLSKMSHRPAWLNLYLRPYAKIKLGSHFALNAWYSYAEDLWREDYKLYPQGEAGQGYYSSSWGLSGVLSF